MENFSAVRRAGIRTPGDKMASPEESPQVRETTNKISEIPRGEIPAKAW
jgi:hypothetical protein